MTALKFSKTPTNKYHGPNLSSDNPYIKDLTSKLTTNDIDFSSVVLKQGSLKTKLSKFLQPRSGQVFVIALVICFFSIGLHIAKVYVEKNQPQNSCQQSNLQKFLLSKNAEIIAYTSSSLSVTVMIIAFLLSRKHM